MSVNTTLSESFCKELIKHALFDEAVKLVKDTYKLEVEANQSKNEFKIKANGLQLLDLVCDLLTSWLERKKKKMGNSIEDRIRAMKNNPLLDISGGHVQWVFWGNFASELLLDKNYAKVVENLKEFLVDIKPDKKAKLLYITCKCEVYDNVKETVENVKTLVTSSQAGSDKSQKSDSKNSSQNDDSKSKGSKDGTRKEIKVKDDKSTSHMGSIAGSDDSKRKSSKNGKETETPVKDGKDTHSSDSTIGGDIPEKSETSTDLAKSLKPSAASQSKGSSGGPKITPPLEGPDSVSDQSSPKSCSEDEKTDDDKLLFLTVYGKTKVFVYEASIVSLPRVSAIVNAANEHLSHGGGVAYHIYKAAGGDKSKLEKECRDYIESNGKIAVTKNFTSSAGNMPYHGVIHAVGPMWTDYKVKDDCAKDLCMTIINILEEANKRKFSTIALPAISSGIFGVPKKMCADMYIRGVIDYDAKNHQTQVREIHFVDISKDILKEIRDAYVRSKQNDNNLDVKNAKSSISGSSGHIAETVPPTSIPSGNPAASQHISKSSKIFTCQLGEKTFVKVYVCSIVEVKDVDAIACEVDTDFSIKRHAVARAIQKAGGTSYEEEFKKMVSKAKSGSGDVFICKTGGSLKNSNIDHVIHIKCEKLKNHEDMDKLKYLYVQVFQCAKKEKMETIVMPLIGAVSLNEANEDVIYECSQLFAKTLKEVVESRGKEMNVKEIHLVDLNEKLIYFISKAFQELNTENTDDRKSKGENKVEPVSRSKSDESEPMSGVGNSWIKVEKGSDNCSFENCKRKGTKKCAHCGGFLCDLCLPENVSSQCPFCRKQSD
ncbi:hypothetical protein CHS0354_018803 [Potamilus streckersoni]|uniref:Macro domain-containing protein n=1 Tax=Potamilus streckersoni TaxID=2493646 RepID=A0AAE0W9R6_9BIVA|nr:hypothetical protein CHS0354_018803 [Potamilus streckersoni]